MADGEGVIFIGSFSKSIAPALRVGYIVAKWEILARILGLKQDAGSGALEQMVLAEFCTKHFADHVPKLNKALQPQAADAARGAGRAVRHRRRVRRPAGRHLSLDQAARQRRHGEARARRRWPPACRSIPGRNGRPTRPTPGAGCASASPIPTPRPSRRASRCWPRSAAASSACRCAAPTWRRPDDERLLQASGVGLPL